MKELVTIAPQMVLISDSNGKYPIHLAIYNRQSYDTVMHLFKQVPETIMIRHEKNEAITFYVNCRG